MTDFKRDGSHLADLSSRRNGMIGSNLIPTSGRVASKNTTNWFRPSASTANPPAAAGLRRQRNRRGCKVRRQSYASRPAEVGFAPRVPPRSIKFTIPNESLSDETQWTARLRSSGSALLG